MFGNCIPAIATRDVPERIRASLSATGLPVRVVDIAAREASLLYYAVASWRRKPFVLPDTQPFSYHKRNSLAAILYTVLLAAVVETAAVHLLVRAFAPRVAVVLLALSAFGALWILGFARSVQLRPILVSAETICIRSGIQWSIDIPRCDVEHVAYGRVKAPAKGTSGYLRVTPGQPNVLIDLRTPIAARGAYGATRRVSRLALVIDDLTGFQRALS